MKTIAKIIKRLFSKHAKSSAVFHVTRQMESEINAGKYLRLGGVSAYDVTVEGGAFVVRTDGFVKIEHDKWMVCPAEMYDIILKDGSILMCCHLWSFKFTHMPTRDEYDFRDAEYWRLSQP